MSSYDDIMKEIRYKEEAYNEALAHNKTLPKGLTVGKIFRIQVMDGYAIYEVTKIGKYRTIIKHRPDLCIDDYRDFILFDGGSFPTRIIERVIESQERLDDIFSKRSE